MLPDFDLQARELEYVYMEETRTAYRMFLRSKLLRVEIIPVRMARTHSGIAGASTSHVMGTDISEPIGKFAQPTGALL